MIGFRRAWDSYIELRNILIIFYSLVAFVLIWTWKEDIPIKSYYSIAFVIASLFFVFTFILYSIELMYVANTFDYLIYFACIWGFGISIFIATIIRDINVIVASATTLLVVITAYSVKKTTDIANRQLKLQNDPIISLSIKENEKIVQIIDLVIENVGNGIAKNIKFEVIPHGFITLSGDTLEKLFFFQHGIQILPSKQKYIVHLVNFAEKILKIRETYNFPLSDSQLSKSEAQRFRRIVRDESELSFIVYFENNEGTPNQSVFNFNLCIFWGLRYPQ